MDKSHSAISSAFGPTTASYMQLTGTPFLQMLTTELLHNRPDDPEEFTFAMLSRMLDKQQPVLAAAGAPSSPAPPASPSPPPYSPSPFTAASPSDPPLGRHSGPKASSLTVFHFNDVYNIEGQSLEPTGGAARFVSKLASLKSTLLSSSPSSPAPLVLFSGDAFNPSLMSTVTKGKQMVPVLNACTVDAACVGNHDLDFGLDICEDLTRCCDFPWLLSNVKYIPTGRNLAEGETTVIIERGGRRVGIMGLVEYDWMATLATIDECDVDFEPFIACARRLSKFLREDEKCDCVIALTHMRVPNDELLARECGDVLDLILGGHDHHYAVKKIGEHGCYVVKSGTDFRDLTSLELTFEDKDDGSCGVSVKVKQQSRGEAAQKQQTEAAN